MGVGMDGLQGSVFVTGGAGFLARALYMRAARERWDCCFTAMSRDDAKHAALASRFPEVRFIRGDVAGDRDFLTAAMAGHDVVIHAAATKFVDLAELSAENTVRVNVEGSLNVIHAAHRAAVVQVVGISTDKACAPVNTYGMTKALMERLFADEPMRGVTTYNLVRYGNVIGSTGSVLPLFRKQLAATGELSITNPDMTRFWMPVDEALDTILCAVHASHPGDTIIPIPRAMTILDVAMAALGDGSTPPNVKISGLRPGEKMHEDLLAEHESIRARPMMWEGRSWYRLAPPGSPPWSAPTSLSSLTAARIAPADMARWAKEAEAI